MVDFRREEALMKKASILLVALISLMMTSATLGYAKEELFDTKAATQHLNQGIAYLNAKNFDAAIREFETSAGINPDAEAYYYLGYAYYLKGRTSKGDYRSKSRENFERAYEIDPNFSPSRFKPTEPAQVMQPDQTAAPTSQVTPTPPGPESTQQQPAPPAD
jgi:tetratricopeptide (TPR) repeat protein